MTKLFKFMVVLLLTGCKVTTPSHPQSDVALPKKMRSGILVVDSVNDLRYLHWWEKLHDPKLNQLLRLALKRNNQLKAAKANILQAKAKLQQSRLAWLPTLSGSANAFIAGGWNSQFTPEGTFATIANQLHVPPKTGNIQIRGYYAGFVPKYTLNVLQNIYNDDFAKASLDMQRAIYLSTRLGIISQMSGSYFMLLGQKQQLQAQKGLVRSLEQLRRLEWSRYQKGASDFSVVANLDNQIAVAKANLPTLQNSIATLENAIQVLLNHQPAPLNVEGNILAYNVKNIVPPNLPSAVLKNRPDVISAFENLKMSKASVGLAYANFFPTIPLTGLLGTSSLELIHLLKITTGLWVANFAASMPLLSGANYAQIKAAKSGYMATYFNYIQTLKSAFADVDNNLTNQERMNQYYDLEVKALKANEQTHALALARYKAGGKDYRDVLNARITVDNAKIAVILAKIQQMDSVNNLYQALAGGYC